MTEKSYNPFKMWGSYVGAIIGFFILNFGFLCVSYISFIPAIPFCSGNGLVWVYLVLFTPGFVIGWGIHSLIRSLRK